MKLLTVILSLLILSVIINSGCGDSGTVNSQALLTPTVSIDLIKECDLTVDPLADSALISDDPNAFIYIEDIIRDMPHVKEVVAKKDAMVVEYDWGGVDVWLDQPTPPPDASLRISSSAFLSEDKSDLLKAVGNKKAIIINVIAADPGFTGDLGNLNNMETYLKNKGFSVTRSNDGTNSVESFKKLSDYGVIIYNGHGGLEDMTSGSYYGIQSGELYDSENISDERKEDMENKRVEEFTVNWGTGSTKGQKSFWGITNKYLTAYTSGYDNSFFYNMACEGMKKPKKENVLPPMGLTLSGLGNGIYFGWTESVSQSCDTGEVFIKGMCDGKTAGTVYKSQKWTDASPTAELKYYPVNSTAEDITF